MKRVVAVMAAGVLAVLTLVAPVAADSLDRPFKGSMSGEITFIFGGDYAACDDPVYTGLGAEYEVYGTASHVGKSTVAGSHCASNTLDSSMTLVAANQDEIYIDYVTTEPCSYLTDPTTGITSASCDLDATVTGGTGRFDGATGEMALTMYFPDITGLTWPAEFTWAGSIGY